MNDKYIELKEGLINNSAVLSKRSSQSSKPGQIFPDEFIKLNTEIQTTFSTIRANNDIIAQIMKKQDNIVTSTDQSSEINVYTQLSNCINQNEKLQIEVKQKLQLLDKLVQEALTNDPDEPETRAQENVKTNLFQQLISLFKETSKLQQKYKAKMIKNINRQIDMIDNTIPEDERTKIIDDPKGLQKLIGIKMKIKPSKELIYTVEDIQDKYHGIMNLEKSIARITKLFEDISMLIEIQQEGIDNIEMNVNKGKNYIMKAEKIFVEQKKEHQKSRKTYLKKMCCIIILGLFVLGLIMFPILYKTNVI